MKVLLATQKPFAAKAVSGIREILEAAGHELVLFEKYAEQSDLVAAVADAEALAAKIAATPVTVSVKVSESGKIYGSVTTAQVEEALKAAGIEVDKKNITLGEIKTVGEYEGSVKCYKAVKAVVKVTVVAEA